MIKGIFATLTLVLNALVLVPMLLPFAIIKLLLPFVGVRKFCDRCLNTIAETWIAINSAWMKFVDPRPYTVSGVDTLKAHGWYLVCSNHQTWVDILVLQRVFNRRIPLLKFFLKQELLYVPVMGLAWWALDFPFMRRSGDPKGFKRDLEVARAACQKFAHVPTSVINFLEGTRLTPAKHAQQQSPYLHLLKPKTGGLAIALATLGEQFHSMLDVTIVYDGTTPTFADLLFGRMGKVTVSVREIPIPENFHRGDPTSDPTLRRELQDWVGEIWAAKDTEIESIKAAFNASRSETPL